jgi:alkylation response protein AidB-like acyl-CoA dehydrogenase
MLSNLRRPLAASSKSLALGQRTFAAAGIDVLENMAEAIMTEDQISYRDLARGFAMSEMEPHAAEWDRKSHFPMDTLRQAASLGFGAMFCKEDYGGTGLGRVDGSIIFEELASG